MTQRLGWFATIAIALVAVGGACIPGTALPPTSPADPGTIPSDGAASGTPSPPGPSVRPSFIRPTPTPLPTFLVYQVRPGDTLTSIARAHETTARSIAFWNRGRYPSLDPDSPDYAPDRIEVGWELLLIPDVELDPEELLEPSVQPSG